jgi:hypothetical protein
LIHKIEHIFFLPHLSLPLLLSSLPPLRAPNPDYSMTVEERRAANIQRAKLIYEELQKSGEKIDEAVLSSYLNGAYSIHIAPRLT